MENSWNPKFFMEGPWCIRFKSQTPFPSSCRHLNFPWSTVLCLGKQNGTFDNIAYSNFFKIPPRRNEIANISRNIKCVCRVHNMLLQRIQPIHGSYLQSLLLSGLSSVFFVCLQIPLNLIFRLAHISGCARIHTTMSSARRSDTINIQISFAYGACIPRANVDIYLRYLREK